MHVIAMSFYYRYAIEIYISYEYHIRIINAVTVGNYKDILGPYVKDFEFPLYLLVLVHIVMCTVLLNFSIRLLDFLIM